MSLASPKMTEHAQRRWQERCPSLDLPYEWHFARKVGKKTKIKLFSKSRRERLRRFQRYVLISPGGAVFVICSNVVITVLTRALIEQTRRAAM